jgi:pyruvate, water dikinase
MITQVITAAHMVGRKIGICGQAPSDYPEFARFLVRAGIDSISLNPDSQLKTMLEIAELEKTLPGRVAERETTRVSATPAASDTPVTST